MVDSVSFSPTVPYANLVRYRASVLQGVSVRAQAIDGSIAFTNFRNLTDETNSRSLVRAFGVGGQFDEIAAMESQTILRSLQEELNRLVTGIGTLRIGQSEIRSFITRAAGLAGQALSVERLDDPFIDPVREETVQRLLDLRSLLLVDTSNAGRLTAENDPNQDTRADLETLRGLIATGLALSADGPTVTKQTLAGVLALDADALQLQSLRFAIEPLFFEVNPLNQPTDHARTLATPANVLSLYYPFSPGSTRGTLVDVAA